MPADRPATVNVIVAALRQHRPALKLATAQLEAETIVLRLQEAGWLGRVALVRRDEVEWLRDSLAGAADLLADRVYAAERLAKARERITWMHYHHMPTKAATAALGKIKTEFTQLAAAPPAKAADLAPLRQAIAEMLKLVEDCLRQGPGGSPYLSSQ